MEFKYIGYTLFRLRKARLLTQLDLADKSNLDPRTISLLENNQQEPRLSTISSLAIGLGIGISEFFRELEKDVRKGKYGICPVRSRY